MITILAEYQTEFLVQVLAEYRRAITKELSKPFRSKKKKDDLTDRLTICDEIADAINELEVVSA
jgi:hypothetical protein